MMLCPQLLGIETRSHNIKHEHVFIFRDKVYKVKIFCELNGCILTTESPDQCMDTEMH